MWAIVFPVNPNEELYLVKRDSSLKHGYLLTNDLDQARKFPSKISCDFYCNQISSEMIKKHLLVLKTKDSEYLLKPVKEQWRIFRNSNDSGPINHLGILQSKELTQNKIPKLTNETFKYEICNENKYCIICGISMKNIPYSPLLNTCCFCISDLSQFDENKCLSNWQKNEFEKIKSERIKMKLKFDNNSKQ